MSSHQGPIFDADNHFYEAHDAFTRHVPPKMRSRCVEWVELEGGRKYHVVGGRIDRSGNRTRRGPDPGRGPYRAAPRPVGARPRASSEVEPATACAAHDRSARPGRPRAVRCSWGR